MDDRFVFGFTSHTKNITILKHMRTKTKISKGTLAEVIRFVSFLYIRHTKFNTSNHSEELKGWRKTLRSQHKTQSRDLHAFCFILSLFVLLDSDEVVQCVAKSTDALEQQRLKCAIS